MSAFIDEKKLADELIIKALDEKIPEKFALKAVQNFLDYPVIGNIKVIHILSASLIMLIIVRFKKLIT